MLETRTGYCQQYSGAMALMLRMVGIPARVVSGFSPGAPDLDRDGIFTVRDTDAHSWVEVYFTGIGWVPFDPTPTAAPAELQSDPAAAAAAYLRDLRACLYAARPAAQPSLHARRVARRELGRSRGLRQRLRLIAALPPGGPRIPSR